MRAPRVRLEAVRAASFFSGNDTREAFQVASRCSEARQDYYLDYCFKETMRQLQKLSKDTLLPTDPKALNYVSAHDRIANWRTRRIRAGALRAARAQRI